jgi:Zn-dependent protease
MDVLSKSVIYLVPLILSLTVHEYAHAWAAKKLGDDTAERLGRLNLNPLSHIDPVGSLLLPIMLIFTTGRPYFAWAKPVPFEPSRFRRDITMRSGAMLVAFAGPLSNFFMLIGAALVLAASRRFYSLPEAFDQLFIAMMTMNAGLFLFNMIPVHPLDGQKVLSGLLPRAMAERYDAVMTQFGSFLLLPVFFVAGRFLRGPIEALIQGVATLTGLA